MLLLMSLPMSWVAVDRGYSGGVVFIGGLDGRLFGSLQVPIWFVIALGVVGLSFALLNARRITAIAPLWLWALAGLSFVAVCWVFFTTLADENGHLALGVWVALTGW